MGPIGHKEAGKTVTLWLPQQAISTLLLNGYAVLAQHIRRVPSPNHGCPRARGEGVEVRVAAAGAAYDG